LRGWHIVETANLAIARDPGNITRFLQGLEHSNDTERFWNAQGLALAGPLPVDAVAILSRCLERERSDQVRCAIAEALAAAGRTDLALKGLADILQRETDTWSRLRALNVLTTLPPEQLAAIRALVVSAGQGKDNEYLQRAAQYLVLKIDGKYSPELRINVTPVAPRQAGPRKAIGDPQI
jgi:hypothetical protein